MNTSVPLNMIIRFVLRWRKQTLLVIVWSSLFTLLLVLKHSKGKPPSTTFPTLQKLPVPSTDELPNKIGELRSSSNYQPERNPFMKRLKAQVAATELPAQTVTVTAHSTDRKSHCKAVHGRVDILVVFAADAIHSLYAVAQRTLQCYAKTANYHLHYVDLDNDPLVVTRCRQSAVIHFRRHCAVAVYLEERLVDTAWLLVLDADTGVVNPLRCIEEYIDDRVNLVFYERLFNWEIACGNYLVRNVEWARRFLYEFADMQYEQPNNWNGFDNGALQIKILETAHPDATTDIDICDRIWRGNDGNSTEYYALYMRYVMCVKVYLGARRVFPGQLKVIRRGGAWVRDAPTADEKWCDRDFMMHGWKKNEIDQDGWPSPFTRLMNLTECLPYHFSWPWREDQHSSVRDIRSRLKRFEAYYQQVFPRIADTLPFIHETEVGNCWPN